MAELTFTAAATARARAMLTRRGVGLGVRAGFKPAGCVGFAYYIEFADERNDDDVVITFDGLTVFVPQDQLEQLSGTTVDYVRNGLNEGFEFSNPQEVGRCGCGESFRV